MAFADPPAKASLCCEESQEGSPPTYAMYEALKDSCQNNATYFQPDDSENGQRLYQGFMTLMDHVDTVWPLVDHVRKVCLIQFVLIVMPRMLGTSSQLFIGQWDNTFNQLLLFIVNCNK